MTETSKNMRAEDRLFTSANIVTIIRICFIPVFVVALLSPWPVWFGLGDIVGNNTKALIATVIFVLISCTDWLDGYLARKKNEVTIFGKFMDPLADKMLVIAALLVLIELKVLPSWPVMIIIAREFIVSGARMLAASKGKVIAASYWGKAKTLTQIIAIVAFLLKEVITYNSAGDAFTNPLYLFAWAVMIISLVLTIISMVDYLKGAFSVVYGSQNDNISLESQIRNSAKTIVDIATKKSLTIMTAESLTGGLISSALTSIPGSSVCILGGVSSYAFSIKEDVLKVDKEFLDKFGAVNSETVEAMCKGVYDLSKADICVAVSGIAGPGGAEIDKPVGTVYECIFCKDKNICKSKRLNFDGNRDEIRHQTVLFGLSDIVSVLEEF